MKLLSTETELAAIKTICSRSTASSWLFSGVDASYFYFDPCVEAYDRIVSLVKAKGSIPSYLDVCSDPAISEDNRKILLANKYRAVTNKERAAGMLRTLSSYRKVRILYDGAERTIKALQGEKISIDEILEKNTALLSSARSTNNLNRELLHFGKGNNSTAMVKKLLSNIAPEVVPTGFEGHDRKNGGFFPGSLVVIGATTGGGKCIVGDSLILCHVNGVVVHVEIKTLWETQTGVDEEYKGGTRRTLDMPILVCRHDLSTALATHMYRTKGTTIRVTLEDGRYIEGKPEHMIKCQTSVGTIFKRLDQLSELDDIITTTFG